MKLSGAQIEKFLQNPPKELLGALIYGPDAGLVSERAKTLITKQVQFPDDPFNSVELQADSLKDDPARLYDELAAIGFGQGKKLIRIRDAGNVHSKMLDASLSNPPSGSEINNFVLLTAGDLENGSLRKLFENSANMAAIPCYVEEVGTLAAIATQKLKAMGIQFDREVPAYLADYAKGDRGLILQAVEKLTLYIDNGQASLEDAIAVMGDKTEAGQDEIEAALFTGNTPKLLEVLDTAFNQGMQEVMLLRGLQRNLTRLHQVRAQIEAGNNIDDAMKTLRPPVFFKAVAPFRQQLNILRAVPGNLIWQWHQSLYQAESSAKGGAGRLDAQLACRQALLVISGQVARFRR